MVKILSLAVFLLMLVACDMRPAEQRSENINAESKDAGVVVHGYTCNGYIQNTNSFPVRVKQVWVFHGENTQWIKIFQPGEKKFQNINHQHSFYVYNLAGVEIGFIHPERNGKKE